jgi:hypothetical protein
MDGTAAIERNREALKRILASLVAMAGLRQPAIGGRQSGSGSAVDSTITPDCRMPTADCRLWLPRHLYLAILRLLRPAEAAARRLIIAASRGMVIKLPPRRKPKPATMEPVLRGLGIAVVVSPADIARAAPARRAAAARAARPRTFSLPLLDPPRRPFSGYSRPVPAQAVPRILIPGITEFAAFAGPSSTPAPPSPDDPVDAARLGRRLAALAAALDDLPGQARRFARWKARREAANAFRPSGDRASGRPGSGRFRRVSPLRAGLPPGGRLSRFDPAAVRRRNVREIDEILAHAHSLALYALERPDTS